MKRALVTGGSGDIGAAICNQLAAAGLHVIVHANSRLAEAERTAAAIRAGGGSAQAVAFDVAQPEPTEAALRELLGPGPLRAYTRATVRSMSRLSLVCRQVRVDGFALDAGEYLEEVTCVAAPIRDPEGEIVASVGISSPLKRLHTRGIARAAADVRKTARAITASLAS